MLSLSSGSKSKFAPCDFYAVRPSDVQKLCFLDLLYTNGTEDRIVIPMKHCCVRFID